MGEPACQFRYTGSQPLPTEWQYALSKRHSHTHAHLPRVAHTRARTCLPVVAYTDIDMRDGTKDKLMKYEK